MELRPTLLSGKLNWYWFFLTLFFVKDTGVFVQEKTNNKTKKLDNVFWNYFQNKTLSAITQAGLVNNLNDGGMIWGLCHCVAFFELWFSEYWITNYYLPYHLGFGQLIRKMSDVYSKKDAVWGMLLQGIAILLFLLRQLSIN
jgi:hypothetical protein